MSERYSVRHDTVASGNWFVCDSEDNNRATGMCTREADAQLHAIALNSVNAAAQPKPEGETVDVRVAVVVAPDRRWKAYGGSGCSDAHSLAADALIDDVDDQLELASFFITASLPVPTTPEIPATVELAKEKT